VSYSIFNIAGKPLSVRYSPWDALTYVLGAATIFWMVINPPQKILAAHYTLADWGAFTAVSFVSILLPFGFYFAGLRLIQPTQAIITSTLEPVIAVLTENIFLGQSLSLLQGSGGVLVLLAIVILQYKKKSIITNSHARTPYT
jgi:drug/metabolite transporter (DMT)-like permease